MKKRKIKPVFGWAVIFQDGIHHNWIFSSRATAKEHCLAYEADGLCRVRIVPVTKKRRKR